MTVRGSAVVRLSASGSDRSGREHARRPRCRLTTPSTRVRQGSQARIVVEGQAAELSVDALGPVAGMTKVVECARERRGAIWRRGSTWRRRRLCAWPQCRGRRFRLSSPLGGAGPAYG